MDNPVTHRELEQFRPLMESENERLKEENDRQNHRIGVLENSIQKMTDLAASTEKLAVNMQNMLKARSGGKRWHTSEPRYWELSWLLYLPRLGCKGGEA